MTEYLSPGVYVEEIDGGPRPIEGVSTSTAGFVGVTERGPLAPLLVTSWSEYAAWFGTYLEDLPGDAARAADRYMPYAVRGFFENDGRRLVVARVVGAAARTASVPVGSALLRATGPGAWGNRVFVEIAPASLATPENPRTRDWVQLTVVYHRSTHDGDKAVREEFDDLSVRPGDPNFIETAVNAASRLVTIGGVTTPLPRLPRTPLAGGVDAAPELEAYVGADEGSMHATGLAALGPIEEIAVVAAPAENAVAGVEGLTAELVRHCETRRDRIAILNGPSGPVDVGTLRPRVDSAFAALYFPWLRVPAPHTPQGDLLVPACGHVAGVYARVDAERGVWKAPANELVRGLVPDDGERKPIEVVLDGPEHDLLERRGVNSIRDLGDRGIRVWGERTTSSDPDWKYVNVRRLFIFLEASIDRGIAWVVFEPNDGPTWGTVRRQVGRFLETLWRAGAFAGERAEDAFLVRCDETTMTRDDVEGGRLVLLVGVAPVRAAELVLFRVVHAATGTRAEDPLAAFHFILEIDGMRAGFAEVAAGATWERRESDVPGVVHKIGRLRKFTVLTLKRGVTYDSALWDWWQQVAHGDITAGAGAITVYDETRRPALVWRLERAWPCRWSGGAEARADAMVIDELELCVEADACGAPV